MYYLPLDNDVEKGGRAFRGSMIRAGKLLPAATTTYKRVTNKETGKVTYPKIEGNELRKAGEYYFEGLEVTGSTQVSKKGRPKFSLMHDYFPLEINQLETLIRDLIAEYHVDVIVRYQYDGAGPHTDTVLKRYIQKEFGERGWIFAQQPSQSPLTNILDCSVFPSLSKLVSTLQGFSKGSRVMDNDDLWDIVQTAFKKLPLDTVGRAFVHHVQMVNAINRNNGGDAYHKEGGLHCGVRKAFAPVYAEDHVTGDIIGEPIGVQIIEAGDDVALNSTLKYSTPNVLNASYSEYLMLEELEFIVKYLPDDADEWQSAFVATLEQQWG